jgi:hypothetical protein
VGEQLGDLLLIPEMIAAGDDIDAGGKDFIGHLGCDARAPSGVFSIGDHDIDPMLESQHGDEDFHRPTTGFTHNVSDKQELHRGEIKWALVGGKPSLRAFQNHQDLPHRARCQLSLKGRLQCPSHQPGGIQRAVGGPAVGMRWHCSCKKQHHE